MNAFDSPSTSRSQEKVYPAGTMYRPARAPRQTNAKTLTLENAECGITLRVGETFMLNLGQGDWNVRVRDETILASADGVQFHALSRGKTKMYATSDLPRYDSSSPSSRRKLFLEIRVTVFE